MSRDMPLHRAVECNDVVKTLQLLREGASVSDAVGSKKRPSTVLHINGAYGHNTQILQSLLDAGMWML